MAMCVSVTQTRGFTDIPSTLCRETLAEEVRRIDEDKQFAELESQENQAVMSMDAPDLRCGNICDADPGGLDSQQNRVHDLADILVAFATVPGALYISRQFGVIAPCNMQKLCKLYQSKYHIL